MKKLMSLFVVLLLGIFVFSACTYKATLDPKVDGAITMDIHNLIGAPPVGLDTKSITLKWTGQDLRDLKTLTNPWLGTLNPTHQLMSLPMKSYIKLTFIDSYTNKKVIFYLPNKIDENPYKNIYLKGQDNGETRYYLIKGGKKETLAIINWLKENR